MPSLHLDILRAKRYREPPLLPRAREPLNAVKSAAPAYLCHIRDCIRNIQTKHLAAG